MNEAITVGEVLAFAGIVVGIIAVGAFALWLLGVLAAGFRD